MKYAIVEISGRQFWVEPGKYYDFNRIPAEVGKKFTFQRVLLAVDENNRFLGRPYVDEDHVQIQATILEHLRSRKTIVYKMRPKKKTRKKQGHRQDLTRVLIEEINVR